MNTVGPSHHWGIFVSHCFIFENLNEINDVLLQDLVRLTQQVAERRIHNVCGG
ncbi:hypothetical protein D3C85_1915990 [compost metagenome]